MGRWLINQKNDVQFAAEDLDELQRMEPGTLERLLNPGEKN